MTGSSAPSRFYTAGEVDSRGNSGLGVQIYHIYHGKRRQKCSESVIPVVTKVGMPGIRTTGNGRNVAEAARGRESEGIPAAQVGIGEKNKTEYEETRYEEMSRQETRYE